MLTRSSHESPQLFHNGDLCDSAFNVGLLQMDVMFVRINEG